MILISLMPAPNKLSENVHGSVLKAVSLPNIGAQLDRTKVYIIQSVYIGALSHNADVSQAQLDSGFPTALVSWWG